jgi:hypothetical protein
LPAVFIIKKQFFAVQVITKADQPVRAGLLLFLSNWPPSGEPTSALCRARPLAVQMAGRQADFLRWWIARGRFELREAPGAGLASDYIIRIIGRYFLAGFLSAFFKKHDRKFCPII